MPVSGAVLPEAAGAAEDSVWNRAPTRSVRADSVRDVWGRGPDRCETHWAGADMLLAGVSLARCDAGPANTAQRAADARNRPTHS
jgi:hypothetical protein